MKLWCSSPVYSGAKGPLGICAERAEQEAGWLIYKSATIVASIAVAAALG